MTTKLYCCIARQDGYQCDCELVTQTSNQLLRVISTMAQFVAADNRVRELHSMFIHKEWYTDDFGLRSFDEYEYCKECSRVSIHCHIDYPCDTIKALESKV